VFRGRDNGTERALLYCAWLHQAYLERSRERRCPEGAAAVRSEKLRLTSIQPRALGVVFLVGGDEAILENQVKAVLGE